MPTCLVDTMDIGLADQIERAQGPGTYEMRVVTQGNPSQEEMENLFNKLYEAGVDVKYVEPIASGLKIVYTKRVSSGISALPLAIIPLISTALVVTVIAIAIFNIQKITTTLVVVFVGLAALAFLMKSPMPGARDVGTAVRGR